MSSLFSNGSDSFDYTQLFSYGSSLDAWPGNDNLPYYTAPDYAATTTDYGWASALSSDPNATGSGQVKQNTGSSFWSGLGNTLSGALTTSIQAGAAALPGIIANATGSKSSTTAKTTASQSIGGIATSTWLIIAGVGAAIIGALFFLGRGKKN